MSFLLKYQEESILFSGDIILGSPSTVVENLTTYMTTLNSLRDNPDYFFNHVCVPHSTSLKSEDEDNVIMDGPKKLDEYIKYREDRLIQMASVAEKICNGTKDGRVTRE